MLSKSGILDVLSVWQTVLLRHNSTKLNCDDIFTDPKDGDWDSSAVVMVLRRLAAMERLTVPDHPSCLLANVAVRVPKYANEELQTYLHNRNFFMLPLVFDIATEAKSGSPVHFLADWLLTLDDPRTAVAIVSAVENCTCPRHLARTGTSAQAKQDARQCHQTRLTGTITCAQLQSVIDRRLDNVASRMRQADGSFQEQFPTAAYDWLIALMIPRLPTSRRTSTLSAALRKLATSSPVIARYLEAATELPADAAPGLVIELLPQVASGKNNSDADSDADSDSDSDSDSD
jgi:hypothetical protein